MSLQASPCHSPPVCIGKHLESQLGRLIYLDAATTKGVVDRLEARASSRSAPARATAAADAAVKVAREITRYTLMPLTAAKQRAVIRLLCKLT
jgi:hypothetical protein